MYHIVPHKFYSIQFKDIEYRISLLDSCYAFEYKNRNKMLTFPCESILIYIIDKDSNGNIDFLYNGILYDITNGNTTTYLNFKSLFNII